MAQVGDVGQTGVRRAGDGREKLLRRGGLRPGARMVAVLAALVVVAVIGGVLVAGGPFGFGGSGSTFEIERGEEDTREDAAAASETVVESNEPQVTVTVHVDGQVASPGVYMLAGDAVRVNDAIAAAGGLTGEADTSSLNLASKVADGQKVYVPAVGETQVTSEAAAGSGVSTAGAVATGDGALININLATVDELQALSGVGEATAKAIVEDRQAHGQFTTVEDLMRVSGIGEKKFEKIKDRICV